MGLRMTNLIMVRVILTLSVILTWGWEARAEIYVWTDERGIVHMTDQFSHVPESIRSRVSVRESAPASSEAPPVPEAIEIKRPPVAPQTARAPSIQTPSEPPEASPPPPSPVPSYPSDTSVSLSGDYPYVPRAKKPVPPFPYNVRLDPYDPKFVWVGPNRVPKSTFTYPNVSLDKQAQFRNRVHTLEQRQSAPYKTSPGRPTQPSR